MSPLLFVLADAVLEWQHGVLRNERGMSLATGCETASHVPGIRQARHRLGWWRSLWGLL